MAPRTGRHAPRQTDNARALSRLLLVLLLEALAGCGSRTDRTGASAAPPQPSDSRPAPSLQLKSGLGDGRPAALRAGAKLAECSQFVDIADAVGLRHVYQNGAAGRVLMVEATGGGCGWLDYDRDGQWDLYLTQGGDPSQPPTSVQPADQLFRRCADGRFENVAPYAGVEERGYSQGVAIGDFDNDGFEDILVTNVGQDVLYHNQGDGTFLDVTTGTIGRDDLYGTSAAWGDLDLDGDLDLYVCNYVDYDVQHPKLCYNSLGKPALCHPDKVDPVPDECFLNLGDGTFRRAAQERGLYGPGNKALGVAIADFDNDGWPDIFVANDTCANFLFVNDGTAHFTESTMLLGCGVNVNGVPQANMGVAVGDYDRNGYLDLYVTHFTNEWNTLYRNLGPQGFGDVTALVGLVRSPLDKLGFGTVMADFNRDGYEELFVANGHIDDQTHLGLEQEMTAELFAFDGIRWHDRSASSGDYFARKLIGRGVASADFDDDGDLDLIVVHQNAPAALLQNVSPPGHWLKLDFTGRRCNRRGIGTRVTLHVGDRSLMQELAAGTSYCASQQPILLFGLGDCSQTVRAEIRWPGGAIQMLDGISVDQTLHLVEPLDGGDVSASR